MMVIKKGLTCLLALIFILVSGQIFQIAAPHQRISSQIEFVAKQMAEPNIYSMVEEEWFGCEYFPVYPTVCIMTV